ncbi:protein of unknown function DUF309 [Thermobispora bispora DSM 43833]|uniref:DUF309 domain-containing protein n=1 Tax=Thermobispora bispora (strain ATCC 19993 / DSM 43833 / CBS 139.67 / JCM 10125 / KCTC 9307 / NBRC 14880 / R51) TaxID=469371 RepID=D6Y2X9_THEBD|nr:protein of unknown function DUF309 [Thermobispora bispora DSM 43833]
MRDRDEAGRPRNLRPRDEYGRPLPHGAEGVPRIPDDYAPGPLQAIEDAKRLLEAGRPFHAHEVFEARWKTGPAEERELWQGLAQICVGLTHVQRGNLPGAATLLTRGSARLSAYGSRRPYGLDLRALAIASDRLTGEIDSGQVDAATAIGVILEHLRQAGEPERATTAEASADGSNG